jgi:type II secretory pathway pseudopilin PulG
LIELLAVIAIASLVAAVTTVGLSSSSDQARMQAAAAQWRDLDARARAFARCVGPVVMDLDAEGTLVRVRSAHDRELLSELALPAGTAGRIVVEGSERVLFDRLGRSADYQVELGARDKTVRWQVCGLTGWIMETSP